MQETQVHFLVLSLLQSNANNTHKKNILWEYASKICMTHDSLPIIQKMHTT